MTFFHNSRCNQDLCNDLKTSHRRSHCNRRVSSKASAKCAPSFGPTRCSYERIICLFGKLECEKILGPHRLARTLGISNGNCVIQIGILSNPYCFEQTRILTSKGSALLVCPLATLSINAVFRSTCLGNLASRSWWRYGPGCCGPERD